MFSKFLSFFPIFIIPVYQNTIESGNGLYRKYPKYICILIGQEKENVKEVTPEKQYFLMAH